MALRDFLIGNCHSTASIQSITPFLDSRGYHEDGITVMVDDRSHPEHLWPTRDRIVRFFAFPVQCALLVSEASFMIVASNRSTDKRRSRGLPLLLLLYVAYLYTRMV